MSSQSLSGQTSPQMRRIWSRWSYFNLTIWQSNDLILGDNDNDSVDNNVTIKSDIGENYLFLQSLTKLPCQGCLKTNPEERLSIDQVIQNKWVSVSLQKNPQWWNVQVPPHFYSLESLPWTKKVAIQMSQEQLSRYTKWSEVDNFQE